MSSEKNLGKCSVNIHLFNGKVGEYLVMQMLRCIYFKYQAMQEKWAQGSIGWPIFGK
jgi:hypothetical protein